MNLPETDIHLLLQSAMPPFANDYLEKFDVSKLRDIPNTHQIGSVDLAKVVGTDHADYAGHTWLELLPSCPEDFIAIEGFERYKHQGLMKRGWNCINDLRQNPDYYTNPTGKNHWSFAKLGDNYYITEGNHRSVVGRFFLSLNNLSTEIQGVSVTEYHLSQVQLEAASQSWWSKFKRYF